MNYKNTIYLRTLLIHFTILFVSFSGWSATNSPKSYPLPVGYTEWHYSEDPRGMQILGRFSNNYYELSGRKIALYYAIDYWPNSGHKETNYLVGIRLSNLTEALDPKKIDGVETTKNIPRYSSSILKAKRIRVKWLNNNTTETVAISMIKNDVLMIFNPYSVSFQKKFNKNKKLCITIEISTGEKLNFTLDLTDPIPTL